MEKMKVALSDAKVLPKKYGRGRHRRICSNKVSLAACGTVYQT